MAAVFFLPPEWLMEIADFIKANDTETNIVILANTMLDTFCDPKLPLTKYSRETLFSAKARLTYVPAGLGKAARPGHANAIFFSTVLENESDLHELALTPANRNVAH